MFLVIDVLLLHGNRYFLLAKILTSGTNKIYSSVHDEESQFNAVEQLLDGRHQDEEEELVVVLSLNQYDKNHLLVLRIVLLVFVELDLEDEFLC